MTAAVTRPMPAVAPDGSRVIEIRADRMVPGLFLTKEVPGPGREWLPADPLKIVAIEPYGERLMFTFDADVIPGAGRRMPFDRDEIVAMWCAPVDCPPWCAECGFDTDGTSRHGSRVRVWQAGDDGPVTTVSGYRYDDPDGTSEPAAICLTVEGAMIGDALDELTPAAARALGQLLIETADELEAGAL